MKHGRQYVDIKIKQSHFSPLNEIKMARVKPAEGITQKTTIDAMVIIDKYNINKDAGASIMDRQSLAKLLKTNAQIFVNWKAGTTPNVLDSIYDAIKFIQDNGFLTEFIEGWEPSAKPTIFDNVIQMMLIGQCNIEDFITRAPKES